MTNKVSEACDLVRGFGVTVLELLFHFHTIDMNTQMHIHEYVNVYGGNLINQTRGISAALACKYLYSYSRITYYSSLCV